MSKNGNSRDCNLFCKQWLRAGMEIVDNKSEMNENGYCFKNSQAKPVEWNKPCLTNKVFLCDNFFHQIIENLQSIV